MRTCWHADPSNRPTFSSIIQAILQIQDTLNHSRGVPSSLPLLSANPIVSQVDSEDKRGIIASSLSGERSYQNAPLTQEIAPATASKPKRGITAPHSRKTPSDNRGGKVLRHTDCHGCGSGATSASKPNSPLEVFTRGNNYEGISRAPYESVANYETISRAPYESIANYETISRAPYESIANYETISRAPYESIANYETISRPPYESIANYETISRAPYESVANYETISRDPYDTIVPPTTTSLPNDRDANTTDFNNAPNDLVRPSDPTTPVNLED